MGRACILRAVKTPSCTTEIQISPHQASTNKSSKQVPLFFYTLYIEGEGGTTAGEGEAIVRVHITDANDNRPEFEVEAGELVAAVPTTAEYGHLVTKVQVRFLKIFVN